MRLIVDRLEGNLAVCETKDRKIMNIPLQLFTFTVTDGDIIEYDGSSVIFNQKETESRKELLQGKLEKLLKR